MSGRAGGSGVPGADGSAENYRSPNGDTLPMCDEPITKTAAEWGRELLDAERRVRTRIADRIKALENGWGFWAAAFDDARSKAERIALDENEDYEPKGYIGGPEH